MADREELRNSLWGKGDPNGRHFTVRLFKVCSCILPRELRNGKLVESWHLYAEGAKYLVSRRYVMIEGEKGIWMTTIQMLVKIAGDGTVVLDTTEKEWMGAKSNPQFHQ